MNHHRNGIVAHRRCLARAPFAGLMPGVALRRPLSRAGTTPHRGFSPGMHATHPGDMTLATDRHA